MRQRGYGHPCPACQQMRSAMHVFSVADMTCNRCVTTIKKAVKGVDSAARCEVDLDQKRVLVFSALPPSDFVEAMEEAGYFARLWQAA
jgi:copper chaperone